MRTFFSRGSSRSRPHLQTCFGARKGKMKIASSCPLRFRKERGALIDLTSSYSVLLCIKLSLLQLPGWSLARMSASSSTKRRSPSICSWNSTHHRVFASPCGVKGSGHSIHLTWTQATTSPPPVLHHAQRSLHHVQHDDECQLRQDEPRNQSQALFGSRMPLGIFNECSDPPDPRRTIFCP